MLDIDATRQVITAAKCSHLLHLAWYVEPEKYWRSPHNLDWIAASIHLIRSFAESGGRRAVIAGTCAEYLWGAERFQEEETPCQPATFYGSSKDVLRRILTAYGSVAPLSVGWGRIFFLYGPGEKNGRLVSDAIRHLLSRQEFPTSHGFKDEISCMCPTLPELLPRSSIATCKDLSTLVRDKRFQFDRSSS